MAKEIIENNVTYNLNHYDSSYHRYFILSQYLDVGFKHIMNDTNISSQSCVSTVSMDNNINYEIKTNSDEIICSDIWYKTFGGPPSDGGWSSTGMITQAIETEFFIDADLWKDVLIGLFEWIFAQRNNETDLWKETQRYVNETISNYDVMIQWRFIGMDNIWLSPAYDRNTFQIGITFHESIWESNRTSIRINDLWTFGIHNFLKTNFAPVTYHWGKQSLASYCDLQESYTKLNDFKILRDELDPNGIFINKFIKDKLGICNLDGVDDGCCCTNSTCKSYLDDEGSDDKDTSFSTL
eukprot:191909_1